MSEKNDGVIRPANGADAAILAELHAASFPQPWDAKAFSAFLAQTSYEALIIYARRPIGFILVRTVADEGEIITLAIDPAQRRAGYASELLAAAISRIANRGTKSCHLEVASDNAAALALYRKFRFEQSGLRRSYYTRQNGAADAVTMTRDFATG